MNGSNAQRYLNLIEGTLAAARVQHSIPASDHSIAVALPFVDQVLRTKSDTTPRIDLDALLEGRVTDGAGHSRPLYRGLALYAISQSRLADEQSAAALARSADAWHDRMTLFVTGEHPILAIEGSTVVEIAFDALAIACASGALSSHASLASNVLERIAREQQSDGPFLARTSSDNPEPLWYHELALLHAVASFASRNGSTVARAAALRAARYQAEQIQPDHASSHPLAMHAFLRDEQGVFLADMMLHAAGVQEPSGMDAVSLLLLADALDCMRRGDW